MRFIYHPEGGEAREWSYRPGKMLNVESEIIEDLTGWSYAEFGVQFIKGSSKAYHALLYVLLHRTTPGLKYDQVQFAYDDIQVLYDDEENAALVTELERNFDALDSDQQLLLAELKAGLPSPQDGDEADPKAPADDATDAAPTSG